MSHSVHENILAAVFTALNTGAPIGVPAFERDRWVDVEVGPTSMPVACMAGAEDDPQPNQDSNRILDLRRLNITFDIYTQGGEGLTASQVADTIVQWIGRLCGVQEAGPISFAGAIRLHLGKRLTLPLKGNVCRSVLEMTVDYRNVTNDLTRVK